MVRKMKFKLLLLTFITCIWSFPVLARSDNLSFQLNSVNLKGTGNVKLKVFMISESYKGNRGKLSIPANKTIPASSEMAVPFTDYPGLSIPIHDERPIKIYLIAINERSNSKLASAAMEVIGVLAKNASVKFFSKFGKSTGWSWLAGLAANWVTEKALSKAIEYLEKNEIGRAVITIDRFDWNQQEGEITNKEGTVKFFYSTHRGNTIDMRGTHVGNFITYGNGTTLDTKTQLLWMRCSFGQEWADGDCVGDPKKITWNEADNLKSNFAGSDKWHLPNINQLHSLIYCSNRLPQSEAWGHTCYGKNRDQSQFTKPTIRQEVFPKASRAWYWSSSSQGNAVQILNFNNGGDAQSLNKNKKYHVRLVRKK